MVNDLRGMGTVARDQDVPRSWSQRALRRLTRRRDGRAPLWIELAIIAWLFWLYDVINDLAPLRHALALANARSLLQFERSLGLDPELTLNRWLAGHATLASFASYYYFFAHAVITFAVLVWLWWWRPNRYVALRTALVIINLVAFVVFWRYPLAPPRSFPALGFIDVIARSHALVSWHSGVLVRDADQFAAMPSLHVAWALWSAVAVWQCTRHAAIRALAALYPLLTGLIVLATGNHYLLDVLAGATTAALGFAAQYAVRQLAAVVRRRHSEPRERAAGSVPAQP
jgi:membrane-associated phospholipid phosphatase